MRKFSTLEKLYINAVTPFSAAKLLFKNLVLETKQRNPIKNGKPIKGIKTACLTKDYSLTDVKNVS